jgi:hypothetical protein
MLFIVIAGIFTQIRAIREESLDNQIVGFVVEEEPTYLRYNMDFIINETLNEANNEPEILNFISQSRYSSVEIKVGEEKYYIKYDSEQGKLVQTEEMSTSFRIKASEREVNKIIELYELGEYRAVGMKILGKVPWKVKITLFRECKANEQCRNMVFGD